MKPACLVVGGNRPLLVENQTKKPENSPVRFLFHDDPAEEAGWLMVINQPPAGFRTRIPRERRVLFIEEPPEIWIYGQKYLDQFGIVNSPYSFPGYRGKLHLHNPCLGWFFGTGTDGAEMVSPRDRTFRDLADYENYAPPVKTKLLSVVCSDKAKTRAQVARIRLVNALARAFGAELDVFGRTSRPVRDKMEAIRNYKYHIVLENTFCSGFFTEKLSDAWLGWSLPVYSGTRAVEGLIPAPALLPIDVFDIEGSVAKIKKLLDEDPYDRLLPDIAACRRWCLENTNALTCMEKIVLGEPTSVSPNAVPEPLFKDPRTFRHRVHGYWSSVVKRLPFGGARLMIPGYHS